MKRKLRNGSAELDVTDTKPGNGTVQFVLAVPVLHPEEGSGQEVMRSSTLTLIAPIGDLTQAPKEIQWRPLPGAIESGVRLLEVDQAELWQAETPASQVEIPAAVRLRVVPGKTILCEVTAFDAGAKKIAVSELVGFRVLPDGTDKVVAINLTSARLYGR